MTDVSIPPKDEQEIHGCCFICRSMGGPFRQLIIWLIGQIIKFFWIHWNLQ